MSISNINSVEIYLLTIKSGGQAGQPSVGTIIFQGKIFVDNTQNIIVGIYETNNPQTNLLLPMDHEVYTEADNIYPINFDGVNFKSETLLRGLTNALTSSSFFNLYSGEGIILLYQNGNGNYLSPGYYEITIS